MDITEVRVKLMTDSSRVKAFVTICFDECFVVHGLKVIDGDQGYFVAMPCIRDRTGKPRDTAHPITNEMRQRIETAVLDKYEEVLGLVPPQI